MKVKCTDVFFEGLEAEVGEVFDALTSYVGGRPVITASRYGSNSYWILDQVTGTDGKLFAAHTIPGKTSYGMLALFERVEDES